MSLRGVWQGTQCGTTLSPPAGAGLRGPCGAPAGPGSRRRDGREPGDRVEAAGRGDSGWRPVTTEEFAHLRSCWHCRVGLLLNAVPPLKLRLRLGELFQRLVG